MTDHSTAYERVTARLQEVTGWAPPGDRGDWRCPAHADGMPSLSVNQGAKGVVLHCQAGCDLDQVLAALDLRKADLFDQPLERAKAEIAATYDYVDEHGALLFQVVRMVPKDFRQRRPAPGGGWEWKLGDTRRVLYRLPKVLDAVAAGEPVFVVEGEKDVHSIEQLGEVATTNPGGAAKWRNEYADTLKAAHVIVVADKDDAGRRHAARVRDSLLAVDATVTVVEAVEGKDVTDHLAAGYTLEQLFVVDDLDTSPPPPPAAPRPPSGPDLPPPGRERHTDIGNALRLVREHGDEIRHVGQWNAWLVWDGRRWARDHAGAVNELAKASVQSLWREASTMDGDQRAEQVKWALRSEGAARLEAMVRTARTDPRIAVGPDDLDADPWALNVANGTVDLRTGHLRPHRPAELHTKVAAVTYEAQAEAPRFQSFLEAIVPDPDVRVFLQRAVGYSLTGLTTEQVLFFAHGSGANGKSTLFETLLALLGDYGRHSDPELLLAKGGDTHPTGVADLMGARLVVSSEIEEGRRLAEATVKQLTGGDRIKARYMRQDFFEFAPTHKLFLHANHRPIVRGTDHAIWRRLRLVPFTVTIERSDQDPHLQARLAGELPGILNWALQGCRDWIAGGLTEPLAVQAATDDYRADMDVLGSFIDERCIIHPDAAVTSDALYKAYTDWCDENGEFAVNRRRLGMSLTERGYERKKKRPTNRWHWYGIGLAAEPQQQPLHTEPSRLPYRDD